MKCTRVSDRFWARVEFRRDITDGPEVTVNAMAHRGRKLKVDHARLTYEPGDGRWECKVFMVQGKVLAKGSGELTHMGGESSYGPMAGTCEPLPEWAERIAEFYRPQEPVPTIRQEPFILDQVSG